MRSTVLAVVLALAAPLPAAAATFTFDTVALTGQPAPGIAGASFSGFSPPGVNAAGQTAFSATLAGGDTTSGNNEGIFTGTGLVARRGGPAPGTAGASFTFLGLPSLNAGGETAFFGVLSGGDVSGPNNFGIFTSSALVARSGDTAPGTGGATFAGFGLDTSLNAAGTAVFNAALSGGDTTPQTGGGLFTAAGALVRLGDPAPGTAGASFTGLFGPSLNDSGQVAFLGNLTGGDTTEATNRGVFTPSELIARRGGAAPGTAGALFDNFDLPSQNNAGEVAFAALLSGGDATAATNAGIFTGSALVARKGDAVPGLPGLTLDALLDPSLNDLGEVAFRGFVDGPGIGPDNDEALFLADGAGGLFTVLRRGAAFDVGGGELRTIANIDFWREGLSDTTLAFRLDFADGSSGIFTATIERSQPGVIPLPASAWLLLAGLAALGTLARRRAA